MIIPNAKLIGMTNGGELLVEVPIVYRDGVRCMLERCRAKHGGYIEMRLDRPKKPRSTGPGSQSAHLHGHLQQLAQAYGTLSLEEIKVIMKWDCVQWPRKRVKLGGRVVELPISESDADTVVESNAIEWCHQRASELGIMLREE